MTKTIIILAIAAAIVVGSIATATTALADHFDPCTFPGSENVKKKTPADNIWHAICSLVEEDTRLQGEIDSISVGRLDIRIQTNVCTSTSTAVESCIVACPAGGFVVTGGNAKFTGTISFAEEFGPQGNGWLAAVASTAGNSATVTTTVVCGKVIP